MSSNFLGLDSTAWTAIATIVALMLGLYGVFGKALIARIWRPQLRLEVDMLAEYSELIDDVFVLRVSVSNQGGRSAAKQVEVFLERIREEHVKYPLQLPKYLPVRLLWCHGTGAICDRIAGGAQRLLDFGQLTFTINSRTGFVEAIKARLNEVNPVVLGFSAEIVPTFGKLGLPSGSYAIDFLITSESSARRQTVKLSIRNQLLDYTLPLSRYIEIED